MAGKAKSAAKNAVPTAESVVNKALKARWQREIARYRAARDSEASDWDDRYEALGDIIEFEPPSYLAGGYASVSAFLKAEVPGETERSVRRAIRVARHFEPSDEAAHGISKLEALLDYLKAHGSEPSVPAKIDLARQRVRVADGKSYKMKPFAEVTVSELRRASRVKAAGATAESAKVPAAVKKWKAALARAKLAQVGVSLKGGLLTFSGIAPAQVKKLGAVLAKG